ncbi:response regulator transcription factor [Kitasatospora sp. NPDC087315]|uniref:response regulator transcription factor n=1 Tax=Kitasatospora sp. NPDC087315 TaxID=3364069 RepID=UPI0037F1E806
MTRPLTPREADAMRYATSGLDPAQIARRLGITPSAVRSTLQRASRKLGARTLDHAIQIHNQPTPKETPMPGQTPAQIAYQAYGAATGGRTYDGRPMPAWEEEQAAGSAVARLIAKLGARDRANLVHIAHQQRLLTHVKCGTHNGYRRHQRLRELACPDCRDAEADRSARRRAAVRTETRSEAEKAYSGYADANREAARQIRAIIAPAFDQPTS